MLNNNAFSSYTCKGEFRALYSKLILKAEATVAPKVYYTKRSSTGLGGLTLN